MLKMVSTDKISNHPDNPRKNLGDLSELADSIKAHGILQNLTIVPVTNHPGYTASADDAEDGIEYYAVIGNRRLGAAKLAGLGEVPCVVSGMDYQEQIRTMLTENIQRSDLTPYEQAAGFQMMLDLGETAETISQKTGFSSSTVRSRLKLLELDQEKFVQASQRGATLFDFAELGKIDDIKLRNSVLTKVGTNNFQNELHKALDKEKTEKACAALFSQLDVFATATKKTEGLMYKTSYFAGGTTAVSVPEDAVETKYFYVTERWGARLYCEKKAPTSEEIAQKEAREKEQAEIKAKRALTAALEDRAKQLRSSFVCKLSNTQAKKSISPIIASAANKLLVNGYRSVDYPAIAELLKVKTDENNEWCFEDISEQIRKEPERHLLLITYALMEPRNSLFDWRFEFCRSEKLEVLYDFLEELGYQVSDEERALLDGTHELFFQPEEEAEAAA